MPHDIIESPGERAPIKGVESDKDSIGKGNATPLDGMNVVLTIPMSEVKKSND